MPEATKPNRDRAGVKLVFNPSSALSPPKKCSFNLVFIPSPPLKLLFPRPVTASIQRRQWHPTPVLLPGKSQDRGAWWVAVHGVAKSWTRLSDFTFTFHFHALERKWQPTPVVLPGESQGRGSLMACHLWGCTESDMTEAT